MHQQADLWNVTNQCRTLVELLQSFEYRLPAVEPRPNAPLREVDVFWLHLDDGLDDASADEALVHVRAIRSHRHRLRRGMHPFPVTCSSTVRWRVVVVVAIWMARSTFFFSLHSSQLFFIYSPISSSHEVVVFHIVFAAVVVVYRVGRKSLLHRNN